MSEIVERVAKAASEARWIGSDWGFEDPQSQELWRKIARVAIAAMREPTPEMIREGDRWEWPGGIWRHMVDAALEPVDDEAK